MELILWRHAEASDDAPSDAERPLTPKGHRQAEKIAKWLREHLGRRQPRLIASATMRSQQTLAAFGADFSVDANLNPGARIGDYLAASGWPGADDEIVILVGHQPEIGMVANLLLHGRAENCSFKKGTIWWLQQQVHAGQCRCELRAMVTPDTI